MTGKRSGPSAQRSGGSSERGRNPRPRSMSEDIEEVPRENFPLGGRPHGGLDSSRWAPQNRDEPRAPPQAPRGNRNSRPYYGAHQGREDSRVAARGQGNHRGDSIVSGTRTTGDRKRQRQYDEDDPDDRKAIISNKEGARFAKDGLDVIKNDFEQPVDFAPKGGSIHDTNFMAQMSGTWGVAGKYMPHTRAGQATIMRAEQEAAKMSPTGEVMYMMIPKMGGDTRTPLTTRSRMRNSTPHVPYSSRIIEAPKDKTCRNCGQRSHRTGQCPKPSVVHRDTAVCSLCDAMPEEHSLDSCRPINVEAGGSLRMYGCGKLISVWNEGHLKQAFKFLVLNRLRRPVLRTRDKRNGIFKVTFEWADVEYGGRMPPEMNGMWPYMKEDVARNVRYCDDFDRVGLENMPPSSLEGRRWEDIRADYENGRLLDPLYHKEPKVVPRDEDRRHQQGPPDEDESGNIDIEDADPPRLEEILDEILEEHSDLPAPVATEEDNTGSDLGDDLDANMGREMPKAIDEDDDGSDMGDDLDANMGREMPKAMNEDNDGSDMGDDLDANMGREMPKAAEEEVLIDWDDTEAPASNAAPQDKDAETSLGFSSGICESWKDVPHAMAKAWDRAVREEYDFDEEMFQCRDCLKKKTGTFSKYVLAECLHRAKMQGRLPGSMLTELETPLWKSMHSRG